MKAQQRDGEVEASGRQRQRLRVADDQAAARLGPGRETELPRLRIPGREHPGRHRDGRGEVEHRSEAAQDRPQAVIEILGEPIDEEARVAAALGSGEAAAGEGRVEQGGGSIHRGGDGI